MCLAIRGSTGGGRGRPLNTTVEQDARASWRANGIGRVKRVFCIRNSIDFPFGRACGGSRAYVLGEVSTEETAQWLDDVISVPPTIMGGIAGGEDILAVRNYESSYLGLVSVAIDSKGSLVKSAVTNAVAADVRDAILEFLKSLRFNPAISRRSAVSSRLFILFMRQDSKAFSDDSSWPWGGPWVVDGSDVGSGFEYLPLGSDWYPDLFTWTTDPKSGGQARKWNPGWGP